MFPKPETEVMPIQKRDFRLARRARVSRNHQIDASFIANQSFSHNVGALESCPHLDGQHSPSDHECNSALRPLLLYECSDLFLVCDLSQQRWQTIRETYTRRRIVMSVHSILGLCVNADGVTGASL